jgi:hypothetical protein
MNKITMNLLIVSAIASTLLVGCGSSNSNQSTKIQNFDTIGAIDCRNVNDYGGEVKLKARVAYDSKIQIDSFTYEYFLNGSLIDFKTPIVTISRDGSVYELNGDMYIYPNTSKTNNIHIFELTYLDGGVTRLYRGGCSQGVYVRVDTNNTTATQL